MDTWTKWIEFLSCGLFVLPVFLGIGLDSFLVFGVTLGLMQILLILVSMAAPTVTDSTKDEKESKHRRH